MKGLKQLFSLLLMVFVIGVGNVWGATTWTRCTSASDLTSGSTFIIGYEATANSGEIIPMKNSGGTASATTAGYMANAAAIDMSTVTSTADYEVTIVASTTVSDAICIKVGDKFIGNENTKNNCKLYAAEATTTSFGVTVGENDVFTLKIAANATYHTLQYNTGSPRFAVYGGTQKNLVIYKKTTSSDPDPEPTKYTVTVADDIANGIVTASPTSAKEGDEVTLTATPSTGYEFGEWNVTNASTSAAITVTENKFTMPAANVNVSATFNEIQGGDSNEKTYNFADMTDFSTWGSSYEKKTTTFSDGAYAELASANKSTQTITDCPVTKGGDVIFKAPEGKKIASLTFTCTQWTTKAQTITLNTSANGTDFTSTSTTSTNFVLSASDLTDVVAIKFTFSSTSNQVGIKSIKVTYVDDDAPTLASIAVKTAPTTLTYVEGQKFNPAGLVITKTMSDETTEDVEYAGHESAFTFDPALDAALTTTDTKVTITYGGKSVNQAITVGAFAPTAGVYEIALNNALYGVSTGNNGTEQTTTKYGIKVVSGCTSDANSKTYYDAAHIRYYAKSYLKLTAPDGFEITKVVFSEPSADKTWNAGPTVTIGSYDNSTKTWTGSTDQLDMAFAAQNRVSKIAVTYAEPATLESVTVSGAPTKKEYIEGDNFAPAGLTVTGNYSDESHRPITEGITWSTPATLTAGQTSVSITATVAGVTSAAYEVTGLTVNAAKNLDHITLNTDDVTKVFWKGETFNYTNLVVTAYYDDETYADVEPLSVSTPNMTLFGEAQTITVSYREAEVTKEATYEVTVKTIANTQETAYTVAEAIALIDAGKDLSTEVYVMGKVSQIVTPWSDQYNNVTYAISEDGKLTSAQFQLYRCTTNDIEERGDVVAVGTLTKYNSTYELAAGNRIVSYTAPTPLALTALTISGDATQKEYTEGDEFDPTGLVVTATYDDESDDVLANGFDWHFSPATLTVGTTSIQVTVTKDAIESAPFTVTGLTVTPAPVELEDGVFTSNADITAGTNSYLTEKINIGEDPYDAFKIGTSKNSGDLSVILPVGTTKFGFHAVSWNTATTTVTIKKGGETIATYDATGAGISGSSPYTYDDDTKAASYHYYVMEMEALTEQVTLNLSAPARVVFYGVNIEATTSVTVGDAKWATFAPSFNVVLPDQAGVKFHYVVLDNVESDKSKLMTTTIEPGTTIKASEGILVQAKPNTEVVFDYAGPEAAEIEGNLLKGVLTSTDKPNDNCYIFTQNDGTVGFKHWETGSLAPNKCYLDLSDMPAGVAPRFIRLATEDTNVATDLDALQSEQTEKIMINGVIYIRRGAELYDVTGRLVK